MKKHIFYLLFLLNSLTIQAQNILHLEDAFTTGRKNSKSLQLSKSRLDLIQAKTSEIRTLEIPGVKASVGYTRLSDIEAFKIQLPGNPEPVTLFPVILNNYSSRLSVSEPIFGGFKWKYAMESSSYLEKAAQLDIQKDEAELSLIIASSYFNIYKAEQAKKLISENITQVSRHLDDVQRFENQGLATLNDVLRVKLQLSSLENSKLDIENNLQTAVFNFNILLGQDPGTKFQVDTNSVLVNRQTETFEKYLNVSPAGRIDQQAANMRSMAASSAIKMSKSVYYPQLVVGGNFYYMRPNPRLVPPKDEFRNSWDLGISLNYDFGLLYSAKSVVKQASIQEYQSKIQEQILADQVKMDINQNFLAYQQAIEKIRLAETTVDQAKENYRIMQSRFNNHVALLTDLLDANVSLLQTRLNLLNARADSQIAYYKLLKASGIKF